MAISYFHCKTWFLTYSANSIIIIIIIIIIIHGLLKIQIVHS